MSIFGGNYETESARARLLEGEVNKKHKLEMCPFCGSKAQFMLYWSITMERDHLQAECKKCRARSTYREFREEDGGSTSLTDPACAKAIQEITRCWNQRHKPRDKGKGRVQ